jgi:homogentisate 1,2-dioxygenase
LAVMVDTFKPLKLTQEAVNWSLENYAQSWLEK